MINHQYLQLLTLVYLSFEEYLHRIQRDKQVFGKFLDGNYFYKKF